ncbi:MAG: 4a-hydroxytetrahydrobiopterin dehydratase [Bryobacterales bacterium]|nr:4a-hydroxytetrahydrobiopterin dehydratase [Bryobacterales bacterium]
MLPKLTPAEIEQQLSGLPGWTAVNGKLHREYTFADFVNAFGFMAQAALLAQAMNHHPEWFNVWSRVVVDLSTHDSGGITGLDFELARRMEAVAGKLQ